MLFVVRYVFQNFGLMSFSFEFIFGFFLFKSKEKLISSLKEGSGLDNLDGNGAMALELEELRHDKELQKEEIQKLQGQVHTLRTEIQVRGWKKATCKFQFKYIINII